MTSWPGRAPDGGHERHRQHARLGDDPREIQAVSRACQAAHDGSARRPGDEAARSRRGPRDSTQSAPPGLVATDPPEPPGPGRAADTGGTGGGNPRALLPEASAPAGGRGVMTWWEWVSGLAGGTGK